MSTVNPYLPPNARVADIEPEFGTYQAVKMWSWRGRIGRLRYLAYSMVGYLLFILAAMIAGAVGGIAHSPALTAVLMAVAFVPYIVLMVFSLIQRSHDMGWSGWTALLAFIPVVILIWVFNGGSAGANRFGAPPPPNTTWVKVGAWLMPMLMVVGILAAVALPAYQQYTLRAKAAQMK